VIDRRALLLSIALAVVAAWASFSVVQFATPVDRALPFLAVVVVALDWAAASSTQDGMRTRLPHSALLAALLMACEVVIADERTRLLAIAIVMAFAFAASFRAHPVVLTILAVLVIRWIPLHDVVIWRELIILAAAIAIALVSRNAFLAVPAALFAPAWPMKITILMLAGAALLSATLRRRKPYLDAMVLALIIAFFPWSGLMARGWRFFLQPPRQAERRHVYYALRRGESVAFEIPAEAESLIVSGANIQSLRPGTPLGTIEPRAIPIRVGDAADWGFMRREQFFASRNRYPRDPAGRIRGYGWSCWIDGAGRVLLPPGIGTIRVTADSHLPTGAILQIESIEMRPR